MENSFGSKVLGLVGLTVSGLVLFSGLFYMANFFQGPDTVIAAQTGSTVQMDTPWTGDVFLLPPDTTRQIGKTRLTYRGKIDADHFLIDVTIPALDPQVYYRHTLKIDDARRGFRLVGQDYRLLGIKGSGLKLKKG